MKEKTHHCYRSQEKNQENFHFLPWKISPPLSGVHPFFTTRRGGVSQGAYESFNLGDHVNDRAADVACNRTRLLASLAPHAHTLALANQVHGQKTVTAGWDGPPPDADAVVTNQVGVVVGVLTADCAPVLLADTEAGVVGAAHAGWKGALAGILESALDAMEQLGARRNRTFAIIGPCIQAASYEVDEAFYNHLLNSKENKIGMGCQKFFSNRSTCDILTFDLAGYVQERLIKAGIDSLKISNIGHCTYARESLFFSHRRAVHQNQAPCGRQMAGIFLPQTP
ncbi:MAG: peptidoglycan editing factor PgeF [Magnetococcales bacterium]|nr:peptidoglycan editing factor PgeF [Magnetococcales bacterium]